MCSLPGKKAPFELIKRAVSIWGRGVDPKPKTLLGAPHLRIGSAEKTKRVDEGRREGVERQGIARVRTALKNSEPISLSFR